MNDGEIEAQVSRVGNKGLPLWKRTLDLTLIVATLPAWLLLGLLTALIIRIGSPGPIFFKQERVGYKGRRFTLFKFRTMHTNAAIDSHRAHTRNLIKSQGPMVKLDAQRDPRLVPFGSLLRAGGLDELPQLINVVRGDMSLVGPRPCIPYEYEMYEPNHRARLNAAPGLTGLWQVSGKNRTTFEEMVRLDVEYSKRLNPILDLNIMVRTLPALWTQYADLRAARKPETNSRPEGLAKPLQSYHL